MLTYKGKDVRVCLVTGDTCHVVYLDTNEKEMGVPRSEVVEKKTPKAPPVFTTKKARNEYYNQKED